MRAESERQEPARRPPGTTGPQCMPQRRIVEGAGTLLPTFLDMRLLTGDEVGLLKVTAVRTDALAPLPSKKLKSSLPAAKQAKADAAAAGDGAAPERARPLTQTRILGRVDRANGIQLLARASLDPNVVVVARASGIVECIDVDSGAVLRWHKCFTPMPEPAPAEPSRSSHRAAKPYRPEHFIGLHEHNGQVALACAVVVCFFLFFGLADLSGRRCAALGPAALGLAGRAPVCLQRIQNGHCGHGPRQCLLSQCAGQRGGLHAAHGRVPSARI
nr:hypothetical protein HK105_007455 [Polyrhizophydium stewartii]